MLEADFKHATDRLLLVTPDEIWWLAIVAIGIVTVVGIGLIVRSEVRKTNGGSARSRGVAPGQGSTVLHAPSLNPSMGRGFGESSRTWVVPKDPQTYAKGMMPGRR